MTEVLFAGALDNSFDGCNACGILRGNFRKDNLFDFVNAVGAFLVEETSARGHFHTTDNLAGVLVHTNNAHQDALFRQGKTVFEHDVANVAHTKAIHHHVTALHFAYNLEGVFVHFDAVANVGDDDVCKFVFEFGYQVGVLLEMAVLAVHRNEVLGFYKGVHKFEFLLAGVSGYVNSAQSGVHYLRAKSVQIVDNVADCALVTGDGVCGDDDCIICAHLHLVELATCHTRQSGHWLALAPGGQNYQFAIVDVANFVDIHKNVVVHAEVSNTNGSFDVLDHAFARYGNLALEGFGKFDNHGKTVDVGCKSCNDNSASLCLLEDLEKFVGNNRFAHGVAGFFHVGGLGQHQKHALFADFRNAVDVHDFVAKWGVVDFEVACVKNSTHGCAQTNGATTCNGVGHVDELGCEIANGNNRFVRNGNKVYLVQNVVLGKFDFRQGKC